jgi:DNA-binding response OmpR family regulator
MPGTVPRILVIDDEVAILRLLKALLGRLGYEVTTAESANEALSLLERSTYDCVITDAVMPAMNGYDFVKALRSSERHAELPILMLTRKRHRQDVKKAVEAGVTDYILKPIDENLLLEKVELCIKKNGPKAADRELPLSGSLAEAEIGVGCRIVSLGENSLTLRLQYRLAEHVPFQLRSRVFLEIGIEHPRFKLESCELKSADTNPDYSWEAKISFERLSEGDANKIREWTHRQALKQSRPVT